MTALLDSLIYLAPICGAAAIIYVLACAIYRLLSKIRRVNREAANIPRIIRANRAEIRKRIGNV